MDIELFDQQVLFSRLRAALTTQTKPIIFLVGSALSYDSKSKRGVPTAASIVDSIRLELADSIPANKATAEGRAGNAYQEAFKLLLAHRGQDYANELIFRSVLKGLKDPDQLPQNWEQLKSLGESLEEAPSNWNLTAGLAAISKLAVRFKEQCGKTVLTTNFDPFVELAIRDQGGNAYGTSLTRDGDLPKVTSSGTHVVHLHGYWRDTDTLHTSVQLSMDRPRLQDSLKDLCAQSTIVVVGYGGWDDIFTRALSELLNKEYLQSDVLWAFYEPNEESVREKHKPLLASLANGYQRGRVHYYGGVDCHQLFPQLVQQLSEPISIAASNEKVRRADARPIRIPDSPPKVDVWVGRDTELSGLKQSSESVVFINGIGGQGKSALASRYWEAAKNDYEIVDWRDCREEGDTLQSQLLAIIERITGGQIQQADIGSQELAEVVKIFFNELGQKKCLFIFDNVDHYIDLETFEVNRELGQLVSLAKKASHNSRFIFTCRPEIRDESSFVYIVHLRRGFSLDETQQLFELRKCIDISRNVVERAHSVTQGHPLWVNLLATQVAQRNASLEKLLNDIEKGKGELPEKTLRSIWQTVSKNEHLILRVMAEMVRSESEENIAKYLSGYMKWNRYSKAMRALKGLNLVVIKSQPSGDELLELHPLVKQFIQREFPRQEERERFILTIITYVDRQIGTLKSYLQRQPSLDILDHWIQKVELDINRNHYADAIETLYEVGELLTGRGYPENFVRVARRIFSNPNWVELNQKSPHFTSVLSALIKALAEFGDDQAVKDLLDRYKAFIGGKDAEYINYCNIKCYWKWIRENYKEAIAIGEEGVNLKKRSAVDTIYDCSHNLALAKRDSGRIDEALEYFLRGKELSDVIRRGEIKDKDGAFYGNIGRCLQLQGNDRDALECYRKSLSLLREISTQNRIINLGYAYYWIGQGLSATDALPDAAMFLEAAKRAWKRVAPTQLNGVVEATNELSQKSLEGSALVSAAELATDDDIDQLVMTWLAG